MSHSKGFILSFVIVIIIFVVAAITGGLLADLVGVWKKPVIGSTAAFCVVVAGYVTAPTHKQIASVVWLVTGAIAALYLFSTSPYPEDKPTLIPLYATYASGIIGLLMCMMWHKEHNKKVKRNGDLPPI